MNNLVAFIILLILLNSCATVSQEGKQVQVVPQVGSECENLGPVTVTFTAWGLPEESLNVLRNNVADIGDDTLVQTGDNTGIAFKCGKIVATHPIFSIFRQNWKAIDNKSVVNKKSIYSMG